MLTLPHRFPAAPLVALPFSAAFSLTTTSHHAAACNGLITFLHKCPINANTQHHHSALLVASPCTPSGSMVLPIFMVISVIRGLSYIHVHRWPCHDQLPSLVTITVSRRAAALRLADTISLHVSVYQGLSYPWKFGQWVCMLFDAR